MGMGIDAAGVDGTRAQAQIAPWTIIWHTETRRGAIPAMRDPTNINMRSPRTTSMPSLGLRGNPPTRRHRQTGRRSPSASARALCHRPRIRGEKSLTRIANVRTYLAPTPPDGGIALNGTRHRCLRRRTTTIGQSHHQAVSVAHEPDASGTRRSRPGSSARRNVGKVFFVEGDIPPCRNPAIHRAL